MATTYTKLDEATTGQNNKITTINAALADVDKLIGGVYVKDVSAGGTITLLEADSKYGCYILTGTLPSNTTLNFDNDIKHPILFVRDGSNATYTLTIGFTTAGTTSDWETFKLQQGDVRWAFASGTIGSDQGMISGGTGNVFFTGGTAALGAYGASAIVSREVVPYYARWRANVVGSRAALATAATAQTDFIVKVNGTDKGTIRFAIAGTVGTFVGNFTTLLDLVPGDVITVVAPAGADATADGLTFAIKAHLR